MTPRRLLLLLLVALVGSVAVADDTRPGSSAPIVPLLWRVQSPSATVYLYGSIHVAPDEALPPPIVVRTAFSRSDALVTEVLLNSNLDEELTAAMTTRSTMPEGTSLRDLYTDSEWTEITSWALDAGLDESTLLEYQPWILDLVATEIGGMPTEFSSDNGLDLYFGGKADARRMRQLGLESVDDQLDIMAGGTLEEQAASFLRTIRTESPQAEITDLYDAWRTGDADRLNAIMESEYPKDTGLLSRERLFLARNRRWVDEIDGYLAGDGIFFVVVGAGHLVGADSVIDLLGRKGYDVTRLFTTSDL